MGKLFFILALVLCNTALAFPKALDLNDVEIKSRTSPTLTVPENILIHAFDAYVEASQKFAFALPIHETKLTKITLNSNIKSQYYEGRISIQTSCSNGVVLEPIRFLPVLLHEYGHTIFEANLEHYLGAETLESLDYEKKFDDGEKSFNYEVPIGIIDLRAPYNELFADVYAVLALDDPHAMSTYFYDCSQLADHRNFTFDYQVDPNHLISDLTSMFTDVHLTLDPVRTFIWQRYKSLGNRSDAKELILSALFRASQETVGDLYHGGALYKDWAHSDVEKMNADLVTRINKYLP